MGWQSVSAWLLMLGAEPGEVAIELSLRSMEDSRAVSGAELIVEQAGPGDAVVVMEDAEKGVITRAHSNERGLIILNQLPAVPMRLTLKADGYAAPALADLDGAFRTHRFEFFLPPATTVTGVVLDDRGEPIADVDVSIPMTFEIRGRVFQPARIPSGRTDARGNFRIEGVPEGMGRFDVVASGYRLSNEGQFYQWSGSPITLRMQRTGVLRVDIDAPLQLRGQYRIAVVRQDAAPGGPLTIEKQCVDRGSVTFSDLPAGRYRVSAEIKAEIPNRMTAFADVVLGKAADVRLSPAK